MDDLTPRPTDRPGHFRRLQGVFLRPHYPALGLALAGMLAQSLLLLPVPLAQGWVFDRLVAADRSGLAADILVALGAMLGCHLIRGGLGYLVGATVTRVSLEVVRELTDAMHRKLQRLPASYFDREPTGRVMARITSDVGSLLIFFGSGSVQLVGDLVLAVGIAGVLVWLNWPLALVTLAVLPLAALNQRACATRARRLSAAARGRLDAVYRLLSEKVSAVRIVRAFAQEGREVATFAGRAEAHCAAGLAEVRATAGQSAAAVALTGLGTVAVLLGGALLIRDGRLTPGQVIAFAALVGLLYNPLVRLTQSQAAWAGTRVAIDRMMAVLDEPDERAAGARRPLVRPRGGLTVRDLSFRYRPDGPWVLDGISLAVPAGTTVGIVGASGSGKSTLLALIARLYDPGGGSIWLDGAELHDVRATDLRAAVALVPQQAVLFEGTIRSNLLYAAPAASDAEVHAVLTAVELTGLIDALPRGLDTPVGERGVTLSGGQRQRLALARALLAGPALLLLDECTNALDVETEARVWANLDAFAPDQSRVIVSNRRSSLRTADRVFILDHGRIAGPGRLPRPSADTGHPDDAIRM